MKRLLAFFCVLCLLLAGCSYTPVSAPQEPDPVEQTDPAPSVPEEPRYITSSLLMAGDAICHKPQLQDALNCGGGSDYDFRPSLQYVKPRISQADYAIVNLETVLRKDKAYAGYPSFNSPPAFAAALGDAGFDLLTTANNHSYDQRFQGLCDTLDQLDELGLAHVGTYRTQQEFDRSQGVYTADVGGISVAFLNYTYGLNGASLDSSVDFCVNRFNIDYTTDLSQLDRDKLSAELAYAQSLETDLVIVLIHWGVEYQLKQNAYQEQVADFLIAHGADLVLGGHSHTPQPLEYRTVTTESGDVRSGFVCYSLGNFVSNQQWEFSDITALLQLQLQKDLSSGETTLIHVSYVPCLMLRLDEGVTPRYYLLEAYDMSEAYEAGTAPDYITSAVYQRLQKAITDCQNIFGAEFDYRAQEG